MCCRSGVVGLVELHTTVLAGCAEEMQDEVDAEDGVFLRERGRWEAAILVESEVVVEAGLEDQKCFVEDEGNEEKGDHGSDSGHGDWRLQIGDDRLEVTGWK
jgi:hypothetical protein